MSNRSPHGKQPHRRPYGFARRASLMRYASPIGKTSRVQSRETSVKISHNNRRMGARTHQVEQLEGAIGELLRGYDYYAPELTARALPLFRRKLLVERQLFVLMRKSIMLNVFLHLVPLALTPAAEQAAWKSVGNILLQYERDEAAIDLRLRKPRLLAEYVEGEIIRRKGW